MNHLVGALPLANPIEQVITAGEAEPLAKFKAAYMAHADADKAEPVWTISPESLPESGWRALDDVTLLRFLRADMRKGVFYPETSMARLLHALAWRKRMGSDASLMSSDGIEDHHESMRLAGGVSVHLCASDTRRLAPGPSRETVVWFTILSNAACSPRLQARIHSERDRVTTV